MKKRRHRKSRRAAKVVSKRPQSNPPSRTRNRHWPWLVLLLLGLYWPLAFLATHLPVDNIAPAGGVRYDKLYHFGSFAILGGILTLLLATRGPWRWRMAFMAIGIAALYGIVDELTQIPVGRTADPRDWLADTAGATIGALSSGWVVNLRAASKPSVVKVP